MVFWKKKKVEKQVNEGGTEGAGFLGESENPPTCSGPEQTAALLDLMSGKAMAWKDDEDARKEFFLLRYEHEQAICGFAAAVFESLRAEEHLT